MSCDRRSGDVDPRSFLPKPRPTQAPGCGEQRAATTSSTASVRERARRARQKAWARTTKKQERVAGLRSQMRRPRRGGRYRGKYYLPEFIDGARILFPIQDGSGYLISDSELRSGFERPAYRKSNNIDDCADGKNILHTFGSTVQGILHDGWLEVQAAGNAECAVESEACAEDAAESEGDEGSEGSQGSEPAARCQSPTRAQKRRKRAQLHRRTRDDDQPLLPTPSCETLHVPGAQLERVMGPCGFTLLDTCRSTGAHITLEPAVWSGDGGDDFLLGFSGPDVAKRTARARLEALLAEEGGGVASEDDCYNGSGSQSGVLADAKGDLSDEELVEEQFDVPREKDARVIYGLSAGRSGGSQRVRILELQRFAGVESLFSENLNDPSPIVRVTARGTPTAVARLGEVLSERLDACAHLHQDKVIVQEIVHVPTSALHIFFREKRQFAKELQSETGASLHTKGAGDRGALKTTRFGIRGTAHQREHAKRLIQDRVPNMYCENEAKGVIERHGGRGYR